MQHQHFHLPWNADEALWQEVQGQLAAFRRVVISITGSAYVSDRDVAFLEGLNCVLRWSILFLPLTVHCNL